VQVVGDGDADIAGPGFARLLAALDHQLTGGGAFRYAGDDERVRADDQGRSHVADHDARTVRLRKSLAADLELAAGDGGVRGYLRNLRPASGWFPEGHSI
jgi:hypothetical protein